jgi:hypothetical protein
MDIPIAVLVTGFLFSTVGFSLFLYGKKQGRLPQLIVGGLMMLLPLVVPGALWITVTELGTLGALWLALRAQW